MQLCFIRIVSEVKEMDVRPEDILKMKKKHPCGADSFLVLRSGMDFKLKCTGCGKLLHMSDEASKAISGNLLHDSGFMLDMGRTILFGLCGSCCEKTDALTKGKYIL